MRLPAGKRNITGRERERVEASRRDCRTRQWLTYRNSVDGETEAFMQDIIDTTFKDCTVLAVMHRLTHIT